MKKMLNRTFLGAIIFLLSTGLSIAAPIHYEFNFLNNDSSIGAVLYLDLYSPGDTAVADPLESATLYTYVYSLENVAFDPDVSGNLPPIHFINFDAILSPTIDTYGFYPSGDKGSFPMPSLGYDDSTDTMSVWFGGAGLLVGQTSQEWYLQSTYEPGEGFASVVDNGEFIDGTLTSALVTPGGGAQTDPVPEPGTLLLLGSGLLAAGGYRKLRSKKSSN
jgi:hypothetical protein